MRHSARLVRGEGTGGLRSGERAHAADSRETFPRGYKILIYTLQSWTSRCTTKAPRVYGFTGFFFLAFDALEHRTLEFGGPAPVRGTKSKVRRNGSAREKDLAYSTTVTDFRLRSPFGSWSSNVAHFGGPADRRLQNGASSRASRRKAKGSVFLEHTW